ncbi:hypothetical protein H6F88_26930 [Oculatella sp. FACHB-28]|uniref:hypothetical protein n=1 Tax=Cyanophyceae TaxID=3028117 RepID=UPI001683C979|nr:MULTISPECIES: hypothetical protein [Cyanophyceae]MBD1866380.1 hypothetical protein [Cyanobacteria bacterium FACHB-471]MBD1998509.1 hypothetical protein [Leptolyngbya sp. FACHB-541]MBD2059586.1 hypothetical protein [Oculatella sp. FACHB-28]MBD2071383.1 hypothetical protein [Leptolyngbya sp. FACHB-671]
MNTPRFKPGDRVKIQINRLLKPHHLNGRTGVVVRSPDVTTLWGASYTVELDTGDSIKPKIREFDLIPVD